MGVKKKRTRINDVRVNSFGETKDKRRKLTEEQRNEVRGLHEAGESIHSLSKSFEVSRRLIQFILYPERLEKNLKDRNARGGSMQYYDTNTRREDMRKHRAYKKSLIDESEK